MIDDLVNIYDDFTKNQRTQNLAQLAKENEIGFSKRELFGDQTTNIKGFKIFSSKGKKRFIGILSVYIEKINGHLRFYDYLNTRDLETKTTSVIELYCEDMNTNYFRISPKNAFSKLGKIFKIKRNDNKINKEFYSNFQVTVSKGDDPVSFAENIQVFLLNHKGITIEGEDNYFLFYYKNKETKIQDILFNFEIAEEFIRLLYLDYSEDFV